MISKRDDIDCYQRKNSPSWKDKNFKTIYKDFTKDSLRTSLLKRNASREFKDTSDDDSGSMIITTNLSFEEKEKARPAKPIKAYCSLEGLNRQNSIPVHQVGRRYSSAAPITYKVNNNLQQGQNSMKGRGDGKSKVVAVPTHKLERSTSAQHHRKYSAQTLLGDILTQRNCLQAPLKQDTSKPYSEITHHKNMAMVNRRPSFRSAQNDPYNMNFQRQAPQYSSYNPSHNMPNHLQRDFFANRSHNSFNARGAIQAPPKRHALPAPPLRHALNTISENDGSKSTLNSSGSNIALNKARDCSEAKALWSKEFYEQLVEMQTNAAHHQTPSPSPINVQNYYLHPQQQANNRGNGAKIQRSVSSSAVVGSGHSNIPQPGYYNGTHGGYSSCYLSSSSSSSSPTSSMSSSSSHYITRQAEEVVPPQSGLITRSNTFNITPQPFYSSTGSYVPEMPPGLENSVPYETMAVMSNQPRRNASFIK